MKTKTLPITVSLLLSLLALIFLGSCNKVGNCQQVATGQNPFLRIAIVNSQNQSLLDLATPNHYDTAMIKKLNGDKILLTKPGLVPVMIVINYTTFSGKQTFALSYANQDNISVSTNINTYQCSMSYSILSVQYNGVAVNPTSDLYYVAINKSL